ncbi:MAG: hypothetical protein IJ386_08015 [Clostridia bacterium]|nr:hypothetical protein [Clostridia bacterium]
MSDKGLIKEQWLERYPRSFPKADKTVSPIPGAIAVSRAGRDRYRAFIITEVLPAELGEKNLRVRVTDGELRRVSSPKKKNLSHLILVGMSDTAAKMIACGTLTDEAAAEIIREARKCQ